MPSMVQCADKYRDLLKIFENLSECEALYGEGDTFAALSKVGAVWKSAALAYRKGEISYDEYKTFAGILDKLRNSILSEQKMMDVFSNIDVARNEAMKKFIKKFTACVKE